MSVFLDLGNTQAALAEAEHNEAQAEDMQGAIEAAARCAARHGLGG